MNEAGNKRRISAETVPAILDMEPNKARRAWARFVADHNFGGELYLKAEYVRLATEELCMNKDRDAEPLARRNLELRLAEFVALRSRNV